MAGVCLGISHSLLKRPFGKLSKGLGSRPATAFNLDRDTGEANYTSMPLQGFILILALTWLNFEENRR